MEGVGEEEIGDNFASQGVLFVKSANFSFVEHICFTVYTQTIGIAIGALLIGHFNYRKLIADGRCRKMAMSTTVELT